MATHAPLPWDTTPGKDVVTSARTPERTEMRERERERRDVAWQHTHPCRGTPPQARTWLPAHAPPKGQMRERESEREREREREREGRDEREKEGTWRGGVATHAPLPWDTTAGKDVVTSARTPKRTEMRERERKRKRVRERI